MFAVTLKLFNDQTDILISFSFDLLITMRNTKLTTEKIDIWPKTFNDSKLEKIIDDGAEVRFDPKTKIKVGKTILYPGLFISGGDHSKECKAFVGENGKIVELDEADALWPDYNNPDLQVMSATSKGIEGLAVKYDMSRVIENPKGKRYLGVYFDPRTGEYGKILVKAK